MGEPGGGAFGVRRKRFRRAVPGRRQGDVFVSILAQNSALRTLLETRLPDLVRQEGLSADVIAAAIEVGSMVLLGNPAHSGVAPVLVGQPARVKVNANIGTSPFQNQDRKSVV